MNAELLRLLKNLKILIERDALEEELHNFANFMLYDPIDDPIITITDLNEVIESEISCWVN